MHRSTPECPLRFLSRRPAPILRPRSFDSALQFPRREHLRAGPGGNFSASTGDQEAVAGTRPDDRQFDVAFVVAPGAELVDIAGPWGVFEYTTSPASGRSPFTLSLVAATTDPIGLSGGMRVTPQRTFADTSSPDIVVVPAVGVEFSDELLDWLRDAHRHATVIMSVCNGSFAVAAAGLLDGRTASCHHGSYRLMQALYPDVIVERGVRWIDHGDVATAGGLTSGTDLALRIVERLLGPDIAELAADELEHLGDGWRDPTVNAPFTADRVAPPGLALDPICGMAVDPTGTDASTWDDRDYFFCSEWCREHFLASPGKFTN